MALLQGARGGGSRRQLNLQHVWRYLQASLGCKSYGDKYVLCGQAIPNKARGKQPAGLNCMISFVLFLLGFSTSGCNKCPCRPRARHVKGAARRVFVCVRVVKVRALATLHLALASYPLSCPSQSFSCRMIRASNASCFEF